MNKKPPIARNLSDRKSREWWAAIDELASKAPQIERGRRPFGQAAGNGSDPKGTKVKSPAAKS